MAEKITKKITYLLGAGASANAIPVVADMHARMKEVVKFLEEEKMKATGINPTITIDIENDKAYTGIIEELTWLIEQAGDYYTIDTLAKKYYLISDDAYQREGNDNYNKLKSSLILYLMLEQFLNIPSKPKKKGYNFSKQPIDKRYSNFIAALAKKTRSPATPKVNYKALNKLTQICAIFIKTLLLLQ